MSTRSQVIFQGEDKEAFYPITIYRHSDGYPHHGENGVLHTLMPLVQDFMKRRGFYDPSYLAAQIAYEFVKIMRDSNDAWVKEMQERGDTQQSIDSSKQFRYLSVGVEPFNVMQGFHGDVAYVYYVKKDCVQVRENREEFLKYPAQEYIGLLSEHKIADWKTPVYDEKYEKAMKKLYG